MATYTSILTIFTTFTPVYESSVINKITKMYLKNTYISVLTVFTGVSTISYISALTKLYFKVYLINSFYEINKKLFRM